MAPRERENPEFVGANHSREGVGSLFGVIPRKNGSPRVEWSGSRTMLDLVGE